MYNKTYAKIMHHSAVTSTKKEQGIFSKTCLNIYLSIYLRSIVSYAHYASKHSDQCIAALRYAATTNKGSTYPRFLHCIPELPKILYPCISNPQPLIITPRAPSPNPLLGPNFRKEAMLAEALASLQTSETTTKLPSVAIWHVKDNNWVIK